MTRLIQPSRETTGTCQKPDRQGGHHESEDALALAMRFECGFECGTRILRVINGREARATNCTATGSFDRFLISFEFPYENSIHRQPN